MKSARMNHPLHAAAEIARSENREPEDALADALSQYEASKKLIELGAYGGAQARRTGLNPTDIDGEIAHALVRCIIAREPRARVPPRPHASLREDGYD